MALIVFAKAPVPGRAKTRLAPRLGAQRAAALAERMLEHALAQGAAAAFDALELCAAPDAGHPAFVRLSAAHGCALTSQGDGDLGARMQRALARALRQHDRVLLIGSDAPALDTARLRAAAAALDRHDAVFVPALDGGYVLVGLRREAPGLFRDIAWSTAAVMAQTRERARDAGLAVAELDPVADVDVPADLVHVPAAWWR